MAVTAPTLAPPALELSNIKKSFGSLVAVDGVSISIQPSTIHAVIGENGAGKTTLMRIAYGIERPDDGHVSVRGSPIPRLDPKRARQLGIGMVHQHFTLVPTMTVAENMLLGTNNLLLNRKGAALRTLQLAEEHGLSIDPNVRVSSLSVGQRQRVEILKMLYYDADILVLDEPTSVLSAGETRDLLRMLERFKRRGKTVIFVSHKLPEILAVADRITVMRRGKAVAELAAAEATESQLARLMVGELPSYSLKREIRSESRCVLEVEALDVRAPRGGSGVNDVSFKIDSGEIVGIAAIVGNGQAELVRAIAGLGEAVAGSIRLGKTDITHASPGRRRRLGLAYMPADRLGEGVNGAASVEDNLVLGMHRSSPFNRHGRLDRTATSRFVKAQLEKYSIRVAHPRVLAGTLSGGNLQRLIAARELATKPAFLIAEEPTWGLDLQAAAFIRRQLLELRALGVGILLVSTDIADELLELADRILVLYRGRIVGESVAGSIEEERLGALMVGLG